MTTSTLDLPDNNDTQYDNVISQNINKPVIYEGKILKQDFIC